MLGAELNHYRIYLLDAAGRIVSGRDAMCGDDHAARTAASGLLKGGQDAEVWSGNRRVGRVAVALVPAFAGMGAMAANDVGLVRGASRCVALPAGPD